MAVRATVLPQPEPGHAILRLTELDASPDGLTLSIERQQGPESHLADDGWRRTEAWLLPALVQRSKGALDFHLGPEICDRLAGIATVRLRVKEPDIGVVGTTVVAWPTMLTSGAIDKGKHSLDDTVRLRRAKPEPAPAPPAPPFEPPKPAPDLRAEREPMPEMERRSGLAGWLVAAVVLVVLAGGGYWAYTNYFLKNWPETLGIVQPTPAPGPVAGTPNKTVRDTVAEYLATKPTPEAMLAKGKELAAAGQLSAAFLVWRRAAEAGNAQAQLEVANFFDPLSPPKGGFTPDGARAADWYERAALAGLPEAQRKYGLLLAKGGAGLTPDQAKAKTWLQQAATQNDTDAKKALESLPK
jgi:Sel1 repeat-containing protein